MPDWQRPDSPLGILERHARAGIWTLEIESRLLWWSNGIFGLHGLDPDDGVPNVDAAVGFYMPWSQTLIREAIEHCLAYGQGWDLTLEIRRADGKPRYVHAIGEREQRPDGTERLVGVLTDVDTQERERQAREALERSLVERSEQWRRAAQNAGLGLVELDIARGRYRISGAFAALLSATSATVVEISRVAWRERIHREDRPRWELALAAYLDGRVPRFECEYRLRLEDGEYCWVRGVAAAASGGVAHENELAVGTIADISARKADEMALRESRAQSQRTFDEAPIGVALVDLDGRWLEVNHALCEITGYSEAELTATTFQAITHPDDLDTDLGMLNALLSHDCSRYRLDKRYRHKGGHYITVQLDTSLLNDEVGDPMYLISHIQDITQARRDHLELFEARELAEATLQAIGEGVIRIDAAGVIREHNTAAAELLRREAGTLAGQPFTRVVRVVDIDTGGPRPALTESVLERGERINETGFALLERAGGDRLPIMQSAAPIRSEDGRVAGAVFVFQDMSAARAAHVALADQARLDPLTRCPNRRAFEEAITKAWRTIDTRSTPLYAMYLDLDRFKAINDICGHAAGDELLARVAQALTDALGADQLVARLGGDEFAALVAADNDASALSIGAAALEAVTALAVHHKGQRYGVGLSVGIAPLQASLADENVALAHADTALYIAKRSGRGRVRMYHPDDRGVIAASRYVDTALSIGDGIATERFSLYAQQIFDAADRCIGFEVVSRYLAPDERLLSPNDFMPTARRMGLLPEIDRWVIAQLVDAGVLADSIAPDVPFVSANLAIETIQDAGFRDYFMSMLECGRICPRRLVIEIVHRKDELAEGEGRAFIAELRRYGIAVWLDDFALTQESYVLLGTLPVDGVKINARTLDAVADRSIAMALAQCHIDMARALSLDVVIKDLESSESRQMLSKAGFVRYQGHLFHRPEPAGPLLDALRQG